MSRTPKWMLGLLGVAAAAGILVWAFAQAQKEGEEGQKENPGQAQSLITTENGQTIVKLDPATQAQNGIELASLSPSTHRGEQKANALVLAVQDLTTLRTNDLSAAGEVEKAKAALEVSKREYERLKQLYQDNQNASAKAVEAAEGAWRSDQTSLAVAQSTLGLIGTQARQSWGNVVASWIAGAASPVLERVLGQQDMLLQVSLPSEILASLKAGSPSSVAPGFSPAAPPPAASVEAPDGSIHSARLVSAFPRVDPRLQTPTFLYITSATRGIVPGMTLVFLLPQGSTRRGVVIPTGAVVWWQGRAWAYAQTAPGQFARREVGVDTPVNGGWFVTSGFTAGEKVVTRGAGQLLAIEANPVPTTPAQQGEED